MPLESIDGEQAGGQGGQCDRIDVHRIGVDEPHGRMRFDHEEQRHEDAGKHVGDVALNQQCQQNDRQQVRPNVDALEGGFELPSRDGRHGGNEKRRARTAHERLACRHCLSTPRLCRHREVLGRIVATAAVEGDGRLGRRVDQIEKDKGGENRQPFP